MIYSRLLSLIVRKFQQAGDRFQFTTPLENWTLFQWPRQVVVGMLENISRVVDALEVRLLTLDDNGGMVSWWNSLRLLENAENVTDRNVPTTYA